MISLTSDTSCSMDFFSTFIIAKEISSQRSASDPPMETSQIPPWSLCSRSWSASATDSIAVSLIAPCHIMFASTVIFIFSSLSSGAASKSIARSRRGSLSTPTPRSHLALDLLGALVGGLFKVVAGLRVYPELGRVPREAPLHSEQLRLGRPLAEA